MAVRGDDDTIAGSSDPAAVTPDAGPEPAELVAGRYRIVRWLALEVMLSPEVVIARIARALGV